jgi:hypothetical protein
MVKYEGVHVCTFDKGPTMKRKEGSNVRSRWGGPNFSALSYEHADEG